MKNLHHLIHKELYAWYENISDPKPKRATFSSRVLRYGIPKEQAIQTNINFLQNAGLKRYGSKIGSNGRICRKCNTYKEREYFSKDSSSVTGYTSTCKECRNRYKAEYRLKTNYSKDIQYKLDKRNLKEGDQIYFNSDIREVISYKYKKGYLVKSILNGYQRMISTSDNHYIKNSNSVRFKKLINKLELKHEDSDY